MLVETKARVGVFAIALGAYLPQFPTLVPEFEQQYAAFKKTIPDTVEVIDGGIVTTKELSMAAGDKFRAADVDLVILQLLTYATSYNMLPAVRDLDVPVVLLPTLFLFSFFSAFFVSSFLTVSFFRQGQTLLLSLLLCLFCHPAHPPFLQGWKSPDKNFLSYMVLLPDR